MKSGIHNSSWLDGPDPAEAFETVKAKAQMGGESPLCLVLGHGSHDPDPPRGRARRAGPGRLDRPGRARRRHRPTVSPPFARRSVIAIRRISPRSGRASI